MLTKSVGVLFLFFLFENQSFWRNVVMIGRDDTKNEMRGQDKEAFFPAFTN
jgi:hypothetical protein